MEELSIEEKAKAYDEAIKRTIKHRDHDGLTLEQYETIDIIFPELKENGDERIRKELIDYFSCSHATDTFRGISWDSVVAWLEKQSEQKPAWSEEDDVFIKTIIRDIENVLYINEDAKNDRINWLASLKDRVQH